MGESIALLSVSRVRSRTAGQELERLAETYIFHKIADGWKIVVAMMHDPGTVLRLA
jgi:ketosteroid isomerase-like protein